MKKKICLLLTFVISIFVGVESVGATYAWIECDYEAYGDVIEDKPLVLVGGYSTPTIGSILEPVASYYRLLYDKDKIKLDTGAGGYESPRDNMPKFEGEWYKTTSGVINLDESEKFTQEEALKMIKDGICPKAIKNKNDNSIIFGGISDSGPINKVKLETQYILYRDPDDSSVSYYFINDSGQWFRYNSSGKLVNSLSWSQEGSIDDGGGLWGFHWDGLYSLKTYGSDFFKISHNYGFKILSADDVILFDNGNNYNNLILKLDEWLNNNNNKTFDISELSTIVEQSKKIIAQVEGNKISSIDVDTAVKTFEDLEKFIPKYISYSSNNDYPMCITSESTSNALFSAYNCLMNDFIPANDFDSIPEAFAELVQNDVKKYLLENGVFVDASDEELTILLKTVAYFDNYSDVFGLDSERTSELRKNFKDYCEGKNISVIINCDDLISDDLREKLDSYMNVFRMLIPIVLIGFGVFDFSKAFFSGSEDEMKKAQLVFFKRIGVAVLIFLVPIFVNLLFDLANMVWGNYYSNCDLF